MDNNENNVNMDKNEVLPQFDFELINQDYLLNNFFGTYIDKRLDVNQAMALDLYRAINCYRHCGDVDEFVELNPEAIEHKDEVELLWNEFDRLSLGELADIAIKALEEV